MLGKRGMHLFCDSFITLTERSICSVISIIQHISYNNPQNRRKDYVLEDQALCVVFKILFCTVRAAAGSWCGLPEGVLELDQMLPAKLGIHYLKRFILETLYPILALKKKCLTVRSRGCISGNKLLPVSQKSNQEEFWFLKIAAPSSFLLFLCWNKNNKPDWCPWRIIWLWWLLLGSGSDTVIYICKERGMEWTEVVYKQNNSHSDVSSA